MAALLLASTPALADSWTLAPAAPGHELQLAYGTEGQPSYLFVCGTVDVRITNFGVTELLDLQTAQKIADSPGTVMTPGAAVMALFTGKGDPDFLPAEAAPNAVKGWDLTIHLDKKDKRLRSLEKADMLSLFTTGYTKAIELNAIDRTLTRDFLKQCGA